MNSYTYHGRRDARTGWVQSIRYRAAGSASGGVKLPTYNRTLGWASSGHEWGYSGQGPRALARAIVYHHAVNHDGMTPAEAARLAKAEGDRFAAAIVYGLPRDGFTLTSADVARVLSEIGRTYWVVCIQVDGVWRQEFGAYSIEDTRAERQALHDSGDKVWLFSCRDDQASIDAAIAARNARQAA